jgi:hypothetical protein
MRSVYIIFDTSIFFFLSFRTHLPKPRFYPQILFLHPTISKSFSNFYSLKFFPMSQKPRFINLNTHLTLSGFISPLPIFLKSYESCLLTSHD